MTRIRAGRVTSFAAVTALAFSGVVISAAPSFAYTLNCPAPIVNGVNNHCYGLTVYGDSPPFSSGQVPTNAVGADFLVNCLQVGTPTSEFEDWEMWVPTNQGTAGSDTWVEGGYTGGTVHDINGHDYTGFEFFWADNRPGGSYSEHYVRNAPVNTWTNVSFYWQGGPNWDVNIGGSLAGESTNNGDDAWGAQAGAEIAATDAITIDASLRNFRYEDPSGSWHGVGQNYHIAGNAAGWLDGTTSAGTGLGAGLQVSALGGCGTFSGNAKQAPPSTSSLAAADVPAALRTFATGISKQDGDANPTGLTYVKTTRAQAVASLTGESVAQDGTSYVVQLHGDFTDSAAHVPPGHAAPTGNTMILVVDAATGEITDTSLSAAPANLAALGQVSAL